MALDAVAQQLDPLGIEIGTYTHDPLGFVLFAFPWGVPGTSLEHDEGPEPWQRTILEEIGKGVAASASVIREAVASGHGVGKSALVSWLILWALATFRDTHGIVTANTAKQLETKTWPELAKWLRLSIVADWFEVNSTAIVSVEPGHELTWRIDAIPWSLKNTEAFAGLHNQGKRVFVAFDEASAIPDLIWETAEGAMTDKDTEILWLVFGNPTRNTGRFRECFGRFRHRWQVHQVDGRDVSFTDKDEFKRWEEDYGEDSDFFRVRVKGVFPRGGSMQLIDSERVMEAMRRPVVSSPKQALIMGVDVARFGDDKSVIYFRRGTDGRTIPPRKYRGIDTMQLAGIVAELATELSVTAIFVDETGLGAGVVDRLRQMRVNGLIGINFGGKADRLLLDEGLAASANKRAEMWVFGREWLKTGCIPNDPELEADLTGVEYAYNLKNEIQLEAKEHMKKRGLASPDDGDALMLTFAYPVTDLPESTSPWEPDGQGRAGNFATSDYDPFADA